MQSILSQGIGYLILLGLGLVMALGVTLLIKAETKWLGTKKTFEWFSTAGRNVKTGLIASSVVSAWTWAATLLQSSTVTYQFGISGPFWYAAGASIQLIIFSIVAIELKRKAPSSHTFPEIIYARFGNHAHKIFLFFAIMTNTIVTAMLVLGGASSIKFVNGRRYLCRSIFDTCRGNNLHIFWGIKGYIFCRLYEYGNNVECRNIFCCRHILP